MDRVIESGRSTIYDLDMTTVGVKDVAAYILLQSGQMTTMKLQNLVYYAQAWSLVWDGRPLFNEDIEAWANGPVVRELYYAHRGNFKVETITDGNPDKLSEQQSQTVDGVLNFYGQYSGAQLSAATHAESPWQTARRTLMPTDRGNAKIPHETMKNYYARLRQNRQRRAL